MTVLQVEGLYKSFGGIEAVAGVAFQVAAGEIVALIGPNGAGKTTCFNLLGGQLRPDRGRVRLEGADITGLPPRVVWRRGVGRTFQITRVFASMRVRENVQMALIAHHRRQYGLLRRAGRLYAEEAMALLERVEMAGQAERPCGVLAYGDLKRVALAMALANAPRLLLLDEPTAGMAPGERDALMGLTTRIVRERGSSAVFTEHDMDVVFAHADRVMVLHQGRLLASGTPEAVRMDPTVREVYLGDGTQAPAPGGTGAR